MKKRTIVRAVILLWGILTMAALPACGKKESVAGVPKDYVYRSETLPVSAEVEDIANLFTAGNTKYAYGIKWNENYDRSKLVLCTLNDDGTVAHRTEVEQAEGSYYNTFTGGENGEIYCVNINGSEKMGNDGVQEYMEEYNLIRMDANGNESWRVCLNEIKELNTEDYFYVNSLICLPGQKLLVSTMGKCGVFDAEGNYKGLLKLSGPGMDENSTDTGRMVVLDDGRVVNYRHGEKGLIFQTLNTDTGALGEEQVLTGNVYSYSIYPGKGYDLLLVDYNNVYGYNIGKEPVRLMNYVDSDLNIYGIESVAAVNKETFWGFISDETSGKRILATFTKVDPKDVLDKVTLTLGGIYIDWDVKGQVVKFNKSNDKYRIQILDYNDLYNTTEDYRAGVTKFNADIASGKAPDIILISDELPIKSYMSKGLFTDFIPLIENDPELDMANMMPNVVKAFSTEGHLYQLTPSYIVMTVYGKTSDVGSEPGWTIKEAQDLVASKPAGTELFDEMIRSRLLHYSMVMGGEQFVDWEKGVCNYDSEAFASLLEFIKTFPEEADHSIYDDPSYWNERDSAWRTGKVLTQIVSIDGFRTHNRIMKGTFGEEVTMIGFPTESGQGSVLHGNLSFAISSKSKKQEGAWAFTRYFITDEYQSKISYTLPISVKAFNAQGEEAMKKQHYLDEHGKKVEVDETYYMNGQEVIITPIDAAELERVKKFIYSVEVSSSQNEDLLNIITEEAAPFFAGQKSVKEVTDIIQSRAKIYVNENR